MDDELQIVHTSWLDLKAKNIECELRDFVSSLQDLAKQTFYFGIDAPRKLLPTSREMKWSSKKGCWHRMSKNSKGYGRHCKVVIKALDLANPQWTHFEYDDPKPWMDIGVQVFKALESIHAERNNTYIHEVFPTASFRALKMAEKKTPSVNVSFENFAPDQKDMIDAVISAVTMCELANNRGAEVGNGDGSIVLPCSLQEIGFSKEIAGQLQEFPSASS